MSQHKEIIKCPSCEKLTEATIEHTVPFWSYVHECECGYIIMESEWDKWDLKGNSYGVSNKPNQLTQ